MFLSSLNSIFPMKGSGPNPGCSAIPGQPVARMRQAPIPWPRSQNQFNILAAHGGSRPLSTSHINVAYYIHGVWQTEISN